MTETRMEHLPEAYKLSSKIALVTGSTAYIGKAVAFKLASRGATVVVNGRNAEHGQSVVDEILNCGGKAIFEKADITDPQAVSTLVERVTNRYGQLDILVSSGAGASSDSLPFRLFQEMEIDDLHYYIQSHWLTRAYAVHAAAEALAKSGEGKIILIGTDAGRIATVGESMIGGATAGMMQMSRALARELGRDQIRVNAVSMSYISDAEPRWGNSSETLETKQDKQGQRKGMLENLRKRMIFDVCTEDIAEAVAFFASPASNAITGQTLSVNGGLSTPG